MVLDVEDSDERCEDALTISGWKLVKVACLPFESLRDHGNERSLDNHPASKFFCIGQIAFIAASKH